MVIKLLSADADPFEITAAGISFALAVEDAVAERHPWLLVAADDGAGEYPRATLKTLYAGQLWGHA
jgi:hypothetical protein